MAKVHGVAGEWARVNGTVVGLWPLFLGVFALGFSLAIALFLVPALGAVAVAFSLVAIGWCFMRGRQRVESFFKGARGEERVAGILKDLPPTYHVFNDFVAGREHVDHVLVGPTGIFAVETKFWHGCVKIEDDGIVVDGRRPSRDPLAQVRREADLVNTTLKRLGYEGGVTPILAFASDAFAPGFVELTGAVVMNARELPAVFSVKNEILPPDTIYRIVTLMENNQK